MNDTTPAMTPEAREILAMVEEIKTRGAFSLVTNLPAAFGKLTAYIQRAELRMFALEESARVNAELLLANHYGRGGEMSRAQLRTVATAARDDVTLRAIDNAERAGNGA